MTIKEKLDKINPFKIYSNDKSKMDNDIQVYLNPIMYTPPGETARNLTPKEKETIASNILGYRIGDKSGKTKYLEGMFGTLRENDSEYVEKVRKSIFGELDTFSKDGKLGGKIMDYMRYGEIAKKVNDILENDNIDKIITDLNKIDEKTLPKSEREDFIHDLNNYKTYLAEIKADVDAINGMTYKGKAVIKAVAPTATIGAIAIGGVVYFYNADLGIVDHLKNIHIPYISGSESTAPVVVTSTNGTDVAHGAIQAGNASANATNHTTNWNIQNVGDNSYILERIEPDGLGSTKVAVTNIEHIGKIASNVTEKSSQFLMENISFNEPTPGHPVYVNTSITK